MLSEKGEKRKGRGTATQNSYVFGRKGRGRRTPLEVAQERDTREE